MTFEGFSDNKVSFAQIPGPFFSQLLPQIDHLGELKVTIYALWRLGRMDGKFRYLRQVDFLEDDVFMLGMETDAADAESALRESISRAVKRGSLLVASVDVAGDESCLYFFNTSKGRAAVEAIQKGNWRYSNDSHIAVELVPERANIYQLYEQNIGPITPMLSEAMQDAEDNYPSEWIEEAFRIAVEMNARNWRYVEAILRRWQERGYDVRKDRQDTEKDTPEDFRRYSRGSLAGYLRSED
ncbi:MAG: DnaD domain protein [Chloroflexota bacterium]|nr:DnaD domain protein [Chloroflexota bacterium]